MHTSIRKASESEIDWINETYKDIDFVLSDYAKEYIAVAETDGQKSGLGRLVCVSENNYELGGMYVFEKFRGQGIAGQIVEHLLTQIRKNDKIWCLPFEYLKSFYEHHGFKPLTYNNNLPDKIKHKYEWCNQHYDENVLLLLRT